MVRRLLPNIVENGWNVSWLNSWQKPLSENEAENGKFKVKVEYEDIWQFLGGFGKVQSG